MAYITKRGNSYSVRYTYEDEHGKSCDKWESFPTKEEATNRKKQIEHELAAGTFLIPSSVTVSYTETMQGCVRRAAAIASARKRFTNDASPAKCRWRTFTATRRLRSWSVASHTAAIPPAAIGRFSR